ncbi:MAG: hypothetical protein L6R37_005763 [Teloschistes peruensis]|nr:MAG: hypothetical protein L6R37_005763 [Teloschistes peruensis]
MEDRNHPADGIGLPSGHAMSISHVIASASGSSIAPSPENIRPSQQTRRLQLRNAGFRGQTLPTRRISPLIGSSIVSTEPFGRLVSNETSPNSLEKRQLYGEDLPPNPVNILQELHNSARRKRHQPRPSIGTIFQDDTATSPADENCGLSWYSEASNSNTPSQSRNCSIPMMKLRDVSFNGRTPPPLSSPLAKQTRGRNGNRVTIRSASAEAAKYIEHLESQLVAVNTKLDSLMSPSSHKARAAKLRALTSEARSLRQQAVDWEQKFEDRVEDEKKQLAAVEISLTARMQALEDEVEVKDRRVRDLEWEMETLRIRVKEAEGLEAVNNDLERRIDLLTNLLVQSPSKAELCSAASSPSRVDFRKRTHRPRPTSMMPRIPPSPGSKRLSLNIGPDRQQFRRSRTSITSPLSPIRRFDFTTAPGRREDDACDVDDLQCSKDSSDLGSGTSSSFRSPPSSSSRPTSLRSSSSLGAHCWGLPIGPSEPEGHALASQKQRRMRRFPSGTASLKPLILPTAAGTQSLPASAPVGTSAEDMSQRDFSGASLDPTIAFLSKYDFSSPVTTPTQPQRRRSSSYAQREAMCTLERRSNFSPEKSDTQTIPSPCSVPEELLETVEEESLDARESKRERPRSLREELVKAELLAISSFDDAIIPDSDKGTDQGTDQAVFPVVAKTFSPSHARRRERTSSPTSTGCLETTLRTSTSTDTTCIPSPKSLASTMVATQDALGLFSRLTCLVCRTKQGPSAIANRLVHNAWAIGVAKLGGLGWWLLGLIYWFRRRKKKRSADAETTVEKIPGSTLPVNGSGPTRLGDGKRAQRDELHCLAASNKFNIAGSLSPPTRSGDSDATFNARHQAHLFPCPDCQEPSSRRSFRLWFRFSLAIILAVGIAIKDGPGVLVEGCQALGQTTYHTERVTPRKVSENSESNRERPHRVDLDAH